MRCSVAAFANKMEWEGGLAELLQYGVREEDIPTELLEIWPQVVAAYATFRELEDEVYEIVGY